MQDNELYNIVNKENPLEEIDRAIEAVAIEADLNSYKIFIDTLNKI